MKYQDFEKGLNNMFANTVEAVDVDLLIANIHATPKKRRLGILPWFSLFALISVISLIGLNNVIELNHQPLVIDDNMKLIEKPQNSSAILPLVSEKENKEVKDSDTKTSYHANTETSSKVGNLASDLKSVTELNSENPAPRIEVNNSIFTKKKVNSSSTENIEKSLYFNNQSSAKTSIESSKKNEFTSLTKTINQLSAIETVSPLLNHERALPKNDYVDCPTFSNKMKWHIDLIPEIGYILPMKSLSTNSSEPSEVFDMRTNNESSLEGIQAALYARVRPGNAPYYLKIGASYTKLTERMNLNTSYTVSDTTIGIISITQSQLGDTLTVITGEIITDSTFNRVSKDHYSLQLIDLPIAVGISKSMGNGWRVGGELGAQFNISLNSKGKLLEGTGQDSYTDLPASGRFSTNVGLSFFAGITLEKAINRNSSFYVSPRFRYFPKSFTPDSYNVRQEYQFVGLHAGYIYSF